jgi:hypothetical protein
VHSVPLENSITYELPALACALLFIKSEGREHMIKISTFDGRTQRRLVLEGKLVGPWADELRPACEKAKTDLGDRKLVIEVKNLTCINQAGENVLLDLMNEGVKFRGCGVFTRQMLKQIARRVDKNHKEMK